MSEFSFAQSATTWRVYAVSSLAANISVATPHLEKPWESFQKFNWQLLYKVRLLNWQTSRFFFVSLRTNSHWTPAHLVTFSLEVRWQHAGTDSECDVGPPSVWCLVFSLSLARHHSRKVPFINSAQPELSVVVGLCCRTHLFTHTFSLTSKTNKQKTKMR